MNSTPPIRTLFGRRITPHHMMTLGEQIYDVLAGEIELGRWKKGERLPGVMTLARDLGVGTKTVQTAYDQLKEEGYLFTRGYRGTYLKSLHPARDGAEGRIAVLISSEESEDSLLRWYQHVIQNDARRRNLHVDTCVMSPQTDPASRSPPCPM